MLKKFTLLLVSTVVCLFIGEWVVRWVAPQYSPSGMIEFEVNSDGVPLLRRKNATLRQWKNTGDYDVEVNSNSLGLRNHKDFLTVQEDALYIVGDSFAFGHGVKEIDRFSDILEVNGVGEVVNIAIPTDIKGYRSLLGYARLNGAKINRLILVLCVENDIHNYSRRDATVGGKGHNIFPAIKQYLTSHSALYSLLTFVVHHNPFLISLSHDLGLSVAIQDEFEGPGLVESEIQSSVDEIKKISYDFNADMLVVVIPPRGLWLGAHRAEAEDSYLRLINLLRSERVKTLDLKPDFELSQNPIQYHFKHDGHWNPAGHKLAAEAIIKYINNNNF